MQNSIEFHTDTRTETSERAFGTNVIFERARHFGR